jgi:hypothetical protein
MKIDRKDQLDLFVWADNRPTATIIDLTPIIVRLMPDVDPRYPEPAKVFRPFDGRRTAA